MTGEKLGRGAPHRLMFLLMAVSLLASACGGDKPEIGEPPEPAPGTTDAAIDPETAAKIQELQDDTQGAILVVDGYWAAHWSEFFTGEYVSPTVSGGYIGNANPPCGGEAGGGAGNAYYCSPEDYIAWDWELFGSAFLDEAIGDSFVFFAIAHEWGHAVQARLDLSLVSVSDELQADCLAAATLVGAAADGTLVFEPGDRGEVFQSLAALADQVEWGDSADHGSADQRIEAYQEGEAGGVNACLPTA